MINVSKSLIAASVTLALMVLAQLLLKPMNMS